MIRYWLRSDEVRDNVFIPKYYDPELLQERDALASTHDCRTISQWVKSGVLSVSTGDEIGKAAYGTGDIPFVRTSDIANWEIKSAPKQGVSRDIYAQYAASQDVRPGDILFVRDGTYLIGNNCFIQDIDKELLFQSHVLKVRVNKPDELDPHLLFLAFNSDWVQRQIRSVQFTADIIDTIGQRFFELVLPIPRSKKLRADLVERCAKALNDRMIGKAFVKHCPRMMEEALLTGSAEPISNFLGFCTEEVVKAVSNETVTAEFGSFTSFWRKSSAIVSNVFLPAYYDVNIAKELDSLAANCQLVTIKQLVEQKVLEFHTGDEIGKMAYGTGDIPFLRTSDFTNWEINHNPKQGVSEDIYLQYAAGQDVREHDVLLVRDGTYLVGSTCMITAEGVRSLFCGGLLKFRVLCEDLSPLDPFLFLGLMNSYIAKRQMRTKQFTRDVIDTLGNRVEEVIIPIPKSQDLKLAISNAVKSVILSRVRARDDIKSLTQKMVQPL